MTNTTFRNACFTINNYTDLDVKQVLALPYSYLIVGDEIGEESKIPHLQCYVEFKKQIRFKALCKLIPRAANIKKRFSPAFNAAKYCKKEKILFEGGSISNPGKRNDLTKAWEMIKENKSDYEICDAMPSTYIRYNRGMTRARYLHDSQARKFTPMQNEVHWGHAGTGKTRQAYERFPNLYRVPPLSSSTQFFDGYEGQDVILIDDYEGQLPIGLWKQLLDGYPHGIHVKGGMTWRKYTKVIITSNHNPSSWYGKFPKEIARRCGKISYYPEIVGDLLLPPTSVTTF